MVYNPPRKHLQLISSNPGHSMATPSLVYILTRVYEIIIIDCFVSQSGICYRDTEPVKKSMNIEDNNGTTVLRRPGDYIPP
jgi:hypothetical protein